MDDDKLHTAYVEGLAFDQHFKRAVLHPSGDSEGYIAHILAESPELGPAVAEARRIVLSLHQHYNKQRRKLSEEGRKEIWKRIREKN